MDFGQHQWNTCVGLASLPGNDAAFDVDPDSGADGV
jgi:hypothetical protein